MASREHRHLKQRAVLWAADPDNKNTNFGERKLTAAVEIPIRWEIRRKEIIDSDGNTIVLDSNATVDREIPVGSILWLGQLTDLPTIPTDLREVMSYNEVPDVMNRFTNRTVGMMKNSDTLPDLE